MYSHELTTLYSTLPTALMQSLVGTNYPLPQFDSCEPHSLEGFSAALVTTHGPELPEFHVPVNYLRDRGASVEVLTPNWLFDHQKAESTGMVVLVQWLAVSVCVKADKKISAANIDDYDAVIILGGAWNPIMLRTDQDILHFIRDAHERKKLIAAICHGPQVLISSEAFPHGARATGVVDIRQDLTNAGFLVEDGTVVYDEANQLITSPNPETESLKAFCEKIDGYARQVLTERR